MAKKKDQAQESAPAPQAQDPAGAAQAAAQEENLSKEGEAPKAPAQPERRPEGIALGRIVVYYRGENTGFSTKLNAIVGVIVGFPSPTDNFQPKDGAVHIKLFGLHGDEVRKGVMYAHGGPKDGRWVFATEHKA